jgi:hypothetical protein
MRIRDELDRALGGALRRASRPLKGTMRSHLLRPLSDRTFAYVALDLLFTGDVDRSVDGWNAALMPEALARLVSESEIEGRNLVESEYDAYRSTRSAPDVVWTWPWTKIYIFLICPLVLVAFFRPRAVDALFGLLSLVVFVTLIVFALTSDATWMGGNWNIATFLPVHVMLALSVRRGRWVRWAHLGYLLVLFVLSKSGALDQAVGPGLAVGLSIAIGCAVGARAHPMVRT